MPTVAERDAARQRERFERLARQRREQEQESNEKNAEKKSVTEADAKISVYFSPGTDGTQAIVKPIETAQSSIDVQAYRLTSKPIVMALLEAHKRGVIVRIVLDRTQQSSKYSDATFFHNQGMTVVIDHEHPIAHNKVMMIDGSIVITGSFNFSAAAEKNAENVVVIEGSPAVAGAYAKNFDEHFSHAQAYRGLAAAEEAGAKATVEK